MIRNVITAVSVVVAALMCASMTYPSSPDEPVFVIRVHCPYYVGSDTVVIETDYGPVTLNEHHIRLEHVSEPCPGHDLEIRR